MTLPVLPAAGGAVGDAAAGPVSPAQARTVAPRIVGLDLSLTGTGIASRAGVHVFPTTHAAEVSWDNRDARLTTIRRHVMQACSGAALVVVEGPSYGSVGGSAFDRAGLWWLVYRGLRHRDIPVAVVSPKTRAKYATGTGNAGKDAVLTAAVRRFRFFTVDRNDEADALWLCAMGHDQYGDPLAPMPAANRAALGAVDWPELVPP